VTRRVCPDCFGDIDRLPPCPTCSGRGIVECEPVSRAQLYAEIGLLMLIAGVTGAAIYALAAHFLGGL